MSQDKTLLEKVKILKQVSDSSYSTNRTEDYPEINIGNFTSDSEEVDQIINTYVDKLLAKADSQNLHAAQEPSLELSVECREKADEIFSLFQKNEGDLVDEEMFVNHWTRL